MGVIDSGVGTMGIRNLSVFFKIFASIGAVVLLALVVQATDFRRRQAAALESSLRAKTEALALLVAYQAATVADFALLSTLAAPGGNGDDDPFGFVPDAGSGSELQKTFAVAAQDDDFAFAVAFLRNGRRLGDYRTDRAPFEIEPTAIDAPRFEARPSEGLLLYRQPLSVARDDDVQERVGSLLIAMSTARIEREMADTTRSALVIAVSIGVLGLGVAFLLARILSARLAAMASVAEKVAEGDLSHSPLEEGSHDEIGRLAEAFNRMLVSQRTLVKQIADTAHQLAGSAADVSANAHQQEQGAREQSSSIEEISSSMAALSDTARVISDNADSTSTVAEQMSNNARLGQDALRAARSSIGEIVERNELIADRINKLYKKSQSIITIVDIIDDISDRLDLLALNAALEGSRVGELGKGFSLVAQEMRRLAENVVESTKEIKGTIEDIHRYIQAAIEASSQGTATSRQGVEEMAKLADAISSLFGLIERTAQSSRKITVGTQQQLTSTQQMVAAMGEVASVSSQGLLSAQEVTRAAHDMADLAARLREQITAFKVDE